MAVFIAKRKGENRSGKWEFPGGTLEEGETHEQCLKRELQEELAVAVEVGDIVCMSEYRYTSDWTIRLFVYRATIISGDLTLNDHEELRWVEPADLTKYDFPEADGPVLERLIKNTDISLIAVNQFQCRVVVIFDYSSFLRLFVCLRPAA